MPPAMLFGVGLFESFERANARPHPNPSPEGEGLTKGSSVVDVQSIGA
jgi:hypothetical protein